MPINPNDEEQAALLAQRELAKALRLSVKAVTGEPLPNRMIVLLLRLAFAQTIRATLGKTVKWPRSKRQESQRRSRLSA